MAGSKLCLECGFLWQGYQSWLCCHSSISLFASGLILAADVSLPVCPGEELIYLDPHTTQPAVEPNDSGCLPDESFHCQHPPCRMSIAELDPSIAVVRSCCLLPTPRRSSLGSASASQLHLTPGTWERQWVLVWVLSGHAVLWASAAGSLSNVAREASPTGSGLIQGGLPGWQ